jgi:hypothetical protein
MIAVPLVIPVTTPVVAFIFAIAVLALVHVPPVVMLVRVVVAPTHTVAVPDMILSDGADITDIGCVAYALPQLLVIL